MSTRQVVGSISDKAFRVLGTFLKKARKDPSWIERLEALMSEPVKTAVAVAKNWLQRIVDDERRDHKNFFGEAYPLAEFTKTLKRYGAEKIEAWRKLGLEPHFLPAISLSQDSKLPGWEIKPENWFWKKIREAKIFRIINGQLTQDQKANDLEGVTVLVDTRLKPKYGDEYKDDWLGQIVANLREVGKIQDFNPRFSRFNVSAEETKLIKAEAAKVLGLNLDQLRLEREIEANVIPQMYSEMPRKNDGNTNTWEWREEFFQGRGYRLDGGSSGGGGLAVVSYSVSGHWDGRSFRFLVVL